MLSNLFENNYNYFVFQKALFNLAEEEILTHKGRSISEAERFDDPRSDDDDDTDGRTGILDGMPIIELVWEAIFQCHKFAFFLWGQYIQLNQ